MKKDSNKQTDTTHKNNAQVAKDLGLDVGMKRRTLMTPEQKKASYEGVPLRNAMKKLKKQVELEEKQNPNQLMILPDPVKAKLTKRDCAVILTLCFDEFTHDGCKDKVDKLRLLVRDKIAGDKSVGSGFWDSFNKE